MHYFVSSLYVNVLVITLLAGFCMYFVFQTVILYVNALVIRRYSRSIMYYNKVGCWSRMGLWEQSIKDYNQTIKIQPNYTKAPLKFQKEW